MSGVKLVNKTDHDIILQEGSGGIFTPLGTIRKGQDYFLKVDSNDTYREYLCKLSYKISQKGEAVTLTWDDFAEYEQVTIMWDQKTQGLSYDAKKRESARSSSAAAADKPSGQASPGLVRRILNKLGWKKGGQTQTDGGGGGGGSGSRGNMLNNV